MGHAAALEHVPPGLNRNLRGMVLLAGDMSGDALPGGVGEFRAHGDAPSRHLAIHEVIPDSIRDPAALKIAGIQTV
ncbi:hypothetical protein HNP60_002215 [Sphingobium sp. B1D3A]|uniref:Uncharacterized protein n=1 Tax=Sphingobium lignivorans TaxID=2735886 RepID=A0ABR6NGN3_9SPHN|nr:hypothetical protein [Sphingobium lignivorans]